MADRSGQVNLQLVPCTKKSRRTPHPARHDPITPRCAVDVSVAIMAYPAAGRRALGGNRGGERLKYIPLLIVAGLMALVFSLGLHRYLSLDALIANREIMRLYVEQHWFAALAAYAATYAVTVALSIPGGVFLSIGSGAIFGALVGGATSVIAATIGAIAVFQIARTAIGSWLAQRAGPALTRLIASFRDDAASYLLFLRFVPAFPFALVNLAPALAGVSLRIFAWTTFVGIIPGTFAFAFAGAGLDSILESHALEKQACLTAGRSACSQTLGLGAFVTPQLLLAFTVLGLVALIPVAWRRIWGTGKTDAAEKPRT
jgi:uncharacterized membrane protein YdjX (TVP38/TMEM64 family)